MSAYWRQKTYNVTDSSTSLSPFSRYIPLDQSISLSIYICLSQSLSIYISQSLSIFSQSILIYLSICQSQSLSISLSIYLDLSRCYRDALEKSGLETLLERPNESPSQKCEPSHNLHHLLPGKRLPNPKKGVIKYELTKECNCSNSLLSIIMIIV